MACFKNCSTCAGFPLHFELCHHQGHWCAIAMTMQIVLHAFIMCIHFMIVLHALIVCIHIITLFQFMQILAINIHVLSDDVQARERARRCTARTQMR